MGSLLGRGMRDGGWVLVLAIVIVFLKIYAARQQEKRAAEAKKEEEERLAKVAAGQLELRTDLEFLRDEGDPALVKAHGRAGGLCGIAIVVGFLAGGWLLIQALIAWTSGESLLRELIFTSNFFVLAGLLGCVVLAAICAARQKQVLAKAKALRLRLEGPQAEPQLALQRGAERSASLGLRPAEKGPKDSSAGFAAAAAQLEQALEALDEDDEPEAEAATEPPSDSAKPYNELRQVAELHREGLITDEEFAAKKRQLLGL